MGYRKQGSIINKQFKLCREGFRKSTDTDIKNSGWRKYYLCSLILTSTQDGSCPFHIIFSVSFTDSFNSHSHYLSSNVVLTKMIFFMKDITALLYRSTLKLFSSESLCLLSIFTKFSELKVYYFH